MTSSWRPASTGERSSQRELMILTLQSLSSARCLSRQRIMGREGSTAVTFRTRRARGRTSVPGPAPMSRTDQEGSGSRAATLLSPSVLIFSEQS